LDFESDSVFPLSYYPICPVEQFEKGMDFIMDNFSEYSSQAEISMRLTEFEMPPMQDILIVGRKAPIGPEAARRMVDVLSPDQYTIEKIEHPFIEAIVVRKSLLNMLPKEKLISLILEEGSRIANEKNIIKAQINITLRISKSIKI
jgi:ribosomal protein L16 Arg81 hydroxylase